MNTPTLLPDRTRLVCRVLKWLALLILVLMVAAYFLMDVSTSILDSAWEGLQPHVREDVSYSGGKKLLLHVLAAIGYFSLTLIVIGAARVFSVFQKGVVFAPAAVRAVRFLGLTIFLFAAVQLILPTLMVLGLTYDNGPGNRALTLGINSNTVILLMIGAVILVIGQILTQAIDIAHENKQFI